MRTSRRLSLPSLDAVTGAARSCIAPTAAHEWYDRRITLTDNDITSFIEMWEAEFNEVLSREQAISEAKRLIDFFLSLAEERLELAGLPTEACDRLAT